ALLRCWAAMSCLRAQSHRSHSQHQENTMARLDIAADARRAFSVIKSGGIAIWPNDVGYGMVGGSKMALQKIFDTKRRGSHKRNALLGDSVTQRELHALDSRSQDIVESITLDFNLPLGVIGPFQPDHPMLK